MNKVIFIVILSLAGLFFSCNEEAADNNTRPNVILVMADDLGWGDVGYNGNQDIKTPHLDEMAGQSLQFNRFYSASAVCSPTRGSVLTGRHPERYGVHHANTGRMKPEEITLAEALKTEGYATGLFGKWHLGTMSDFVIESNRGGFSWSSEYYSPPWENGFDVSFASESKIPTWDPMWTPSQEAAGVSSDQKEGDAYGTYYWTGKGELATENLDGDDSRVIMDRTIPFIEQSVEKDQPFLAVVWFHTPHSPVVAGSKYKQMYSDYEENKQHYYGTITAMDEQVGRLREKLREVGEAENTILFFTSDNGPAGEGGGTAQHPGRRQQGTSGPYRGRKGSLYEGGIRVPGLLEWPAKIREHRETDMPAVTSDYYPTILDLLDIEMQDQPKPLDGISLLPLIKDNQENREDPIAFKFGDQQAYMNGQYKIYSGNGGDTYQLFNLMEDPYEKNDLAEEMPDKVNTMQEKLNQWMESCKRSEKGNDY